MFVQFLFDNWNHPPARAAATGKQHSKASKKKMEGDQLGQTGILEEIAFPPIPEVLPAIAISPNPVFCTHPFSIFFYVSSRWCNERNVRVRAHLQISLSFFSARKPTFFKIGPVKNFLKLKIKN